MGQRALVASVVLLLAVSACSNAGTAAETSTTIAPIGSSRPLATVNGVSIPIINVTTLHEDFGQLSSDEIASSVLLLVLNQLLFNEAQAQFALVLDQAEIATAVDARTERFGTEARMNEVLAAQNETVTRLELEAQLDVMRATVGERLVRDGAEGFDIDLAYRQFLLTESTVCVQHIQVLTQEGFELVESRIAAGEDFATVAMENSLDPLVDRTDGGSGAGGDLGCRSPASTPFPEAAIEAPVDEYVGPVFTDVGTHLIRVYERDAPALEAVRDAVIEVGVETQAVGLFNAWAVQQLQAADVTIDEDFGTWGVLPETNGVPTVIPAGAS